MSLLVGYPRRSFAGLGHRRFDCLYADVEFEVDSAPRAILRKMMGGYNLPTQPTVLRAVHRESKLPLNPPYPSVLPCCPCLAQHSCQAL